MSETREDAAVTTITDELRLAISNGPMVITPDLLQRAVTEIESLRAERLGIADAVAKASGMRSNDLVSDIESLIRVLRSTQANLSSLRAQMQELVEQWNAQADVYKKQVSEGHLWGSDLYYSNGQNWAKRQCANDLSVLITGETSGAQKKSQN